MKTLKQKFLFSAVIAFAISFSVQAQTSVCVGDTYSYSITNNVGCGSGGTVSFSGAVGGSISNANSSTVTVTWTSAGTFTLRRTGVPASSWPNGCAGGATTTTNGPTVTVYSEPPTPSTPSVSSNSCGSKILTRGNPPSGVTWYWQGTNSNGFSTANSNSVYLVPNSGTYYIRSRNNGGCWGNARAVSVSINQTPSTPTTPSQTTLTCGEKRLTRSSPPAGMTWYWQGTNHNGFSTANSSSTYTVSSSGTYYIRAKNDNANCWSGSRAVTVNISPTVSQPPAPSVSSNTCGNKTLNMTSPWSGVTFYWQGTNSNGTSTSNSTSSNYTVTSSGTYYVRSRDNTTNCWSAPRSISVTINPYPPQPPSFSVSTNTCGNKTLTRSGSPPSGVTWYWQGKSSNGQSTSSSGSTYTATSSGTHYIRPRNNTSLCWGTPRGVNVTVNATPPVPSTPTVSTNTCGDKTLVITSPPSGMTWYWQGTNSNGFSTTNSNSTLTVTSSGTYYIRAKNNNANCWGSPRAVAVTVNQSPSAPATPSVSTNSCGNKTLTRSGSVPSGVTWYWQGTDDNGFSTENNSSTYTASASGTYYIRAKRNGVNCWSTSVPVNVTFNTPPSMPPTPSVSSNTCGNKTLNMTSPWSGVTFYWQGTNSNGTSTSNSTSSNYTVTSSGTYYVRSRDNTTNCWSAPRSISVTINPYPPQPPSFSVSTNTCGNKTLTRSGSPPSGVTWYWQGKSSNGQSTSSSGSTYTATSSGTHYIRPRNNTSLCWGTPRGVNVTVNATPPVPSTPTVSTNTCGDKTLVITSPPSGMTWYWQGTNSNGFSTTNSNSTLTVTSSGTYYIRTKNDNADCWSNPLPITVTVNQTPAVPTTPTVSSNTCGDKTLSMAGTAPVGVTWYWQGTDDNGFSTENSATSFLVSADGTYYLRAKNDNANCWSASIPVSITINPPPSMPPTPSVSTNTCGPKLLSLSSAYSGVTWYWQGTNATSMSTNDPTTEDYAAESSGTYFVRAQNNSTLCWSDPRAVSVSVNPLPTEPPPFLISTNACGNKTLTQSGTVPSGVTWYWQGNAPNGQSTDYSSTTFPATSSGTYYLRPQDNDTECWGPPRGMQVDVTQNSPAPTITVSYNADCSVATLTSSVGSDNYWSTESTASSITVTSSGTYWLENSNGTCSGARRYVSITFPIAGTLSGGVSQPVNVATRLELTGNNTPVSRWEYTQEGGSPVVVSSTSSFLDVSFSNSGSSHLTRTYYAVIGGEDGCEITSNSVNVTAEAIGNATVFYCVGDLGNPGMPPLANIDCPFISLGWVDGEVGGVQDGSTIRWTTPGIYQAYTIHGPCNGENRVDYGEVVQVYAIPEAPPLSDINVTYESDCSATLTYTGSDEILWSSGATTTSINVTTSGPQSIRKVVNGCPSSPTTLTINFPDPGILSGGASNPGRVTATLTLTGQGNTVKRWEYTEGGGTPVVINSSDTELEVEFSTCSSLGITRDYYAVINGFGGCELTTNSVIVSATGLLSPVTPITTLSKSNLGCNLVELTYPANAGPTEGLWSWQETSDGEDGSLSLSTNAFVVNKPGTYFLRHKTGCSWSGAISIVVRS